MEPLEHSLGRHNGAERARPLRVESSRVKSSRVESNGVEWSRVESSRVEWSQVESSGVEWSRVESSGVEWSRVEWSRVESSGVESSGVEWSGVESSQPMAPSDRRHSELTSRICATASVAPRPKLSMEGIDEGSAASCELTRLATAPPPDGGGGWPGVQPGGWAAAGDSCSAAGAAWLVPEMEAYAAEPADRTTTTAVEPREKTVPLARVRTACSVGWELAIEVGSERRARQHAVVERRAKRTRSISSSLSRIVRARGDQRDSSLKSGAWICICICVCLEGER